ncbi:LLM class flavin-dependent oxidoreductase [Litchfieldia salsa]|uniref:Luciferase family oxidoreductase, group 1 n=1 Tax=Litchfieldia salsa TaxID=930152 RepID=A0A1H0WAN6_9BACI|nr:LLM class flavin-dependent oxidoreductase [Litchfieldia salsa]SDP87376.1 luciferase family oxidoreductase, group 1 [Litchfieldia salsa]
MNLSVLDQSVIRKGSNATETFKETVQLAKRAEQLGYTRFWVAEHHNTNGIAGSSPEVLISHIASQTNRIRVGSGGVLLPQYSPYKVAENFKVLEALFPGRIDLGIGRSPGGSPNTRLALTDGVTKSLNEFPRQIKQLQTYLDHNIKDADEVLATPFIDTAAEVWILGITHRGARVAAEHGTAFTYGQFINPENGKRSLDYYHTHFQPSSTLKKPTTNVCVFVVCAPTDEQAEELALSQHLWLLAVGGSRKDIRIPSIEEAKKRFLSREEQAIIKENRKRMIIGSPTKVREELLRLSDHYQNDEFMVITNIYDFQAKVRSYELLAEMFL